MHEHAVVVATAALEDLDRIEGAGLRNTDHELDAGVAQRSQDFKGRIAAIEHEHVPPLQVRDQLQQLLPLARGARRDRGSNRESADDVVQRRHQHLRAVSTVRHSEMLGELGAALQVMAHAIHREDPAPVPEQPCRVLLTNGVADHREQGRQQLRLQLAPRLAESRRGDGLLARQLDPRSACFLPEGIEQQAVAATTCIGSHEQQQRHQQLRSQRASPREVRRLAATVPSPSRLEQLSDENHQRFVERRQYGGAGFCQPLACQFADVSLLSRRIVCRRLPSTQFITHEKAIHAHSRTSFDGSRPGEHAADPDDKVNGIGVDADR